MPSEEIFTGLNNAVANGESLEKAKQSLLMAGYNPQEVQEAAGQINMGIIGRVEQKTETLEYKSLPKENQEKPKKKKWVLPVILIIVFLILIGIGMFLAVGTDLLK